MTDIPGDRYVGPGGLLVGRGIAALVERSTKGQDDAVAYACGSCLEI